MTAYYNEIDPFAAAWLRNLIAENLIAPGDVDERSIADVRPSDLEGYTQCHFFAGIGGWSYAARLAGIPDDYPIWTGSCPCQPFSAAGKRKAQADERHLWPAFFDLIRQCRADRIFGEQVEGAIRLGWLDGISTDLEAEGYALGHCVLGAHSVGAPHIRQRLYWVADSLRGGTGHTPRQGVGAQAAPDGGDGSVSRERLRLGIEGPSGDGLADTDGWHPGAEWQQRGGEQRQQPQDGGAGERVANPDSGTGRQERPVGSGRDQGSDAQERRGPGGNGVACGMGDANGAGYALGNRLGRDDESEVRAATRQAPFKASPWGSATWIDCTDGKARRVEPGIFPLAHGLPNGVGALRGAGNAIVPQVAAEFMRAAMETIKHKGRR